MENRNPPRHKSPGHNFDRGRGKSPYRPPGGSDGQMRGRGRPGNSKDGRDPNRSRGPGRPSRRDGAPARNPDQRFGDRNRFGQRNVGSRGPIGGGKRQQRTEPEIKIVSDSQITDGKFRGKSLLNSVSPHGVPTQRKVREIAFRILARRVKAGRILDLGAACGTIGIEAISRGAMLVTFVERSARMCTLLRKNLAELGIRDGHGEVVEMEAMPFLVRSTRRRRVWDIVYLDIPSDDAHSSLVEYLGRGSNIKQSGLLVIQHPPTASFPEKISNLNRWRIVDQGETILTIYERM